MHDRCLANGLLHLGDLAPGSRPQATLAEHHDLDVMAYTGQRLFADKDRVSLTQLAPDEVQEWCLSRITEHRNHNHLLRERYGGAARDAISKTKAHVRALLSAYNHAAPINQSLPPEVLMEVFGHVHPAVLPPRLRVPVLRVCRYWRRLLFHTPQFWANILSLPTWKSWNPNNHMGRFQAAMARSVPRSLTLSVLDCHTAIVDTLTSHATRLSSLKVGPTFYSVESIAQVLEQPMPLLTHLAILHQRPWWMNARTLNLNFPGYPNIQTLEFEDTYFYAPATPYASLRHLKLKHCAIRPPLTVSSVPALCAVHAALELFPNLETLSMICSLSDDDRRGELRTLPELTATVSLPHLRHLEIEDIPAYIPLFLSHLAFPSTASLVLQPAYTRDFSRRPPAVPLFPGMNPSPAPNAELSLHLDSRGLLDDSTLVRWETLRADGVRPVRVTLPGAAHSGRDSDIALVARFTRELVAALAPAPAPGVTSLTAQRTWLPRSQCWGQLLRELPGLRRLACDQMCTTRDLADVLSDSKRAPEGGFLCAHLEEMALEWDVPRGIDLGLGGGEWDALRHWQDDGHRNLEESGPAESRLAASLSEFCDTLGACLAQRAGHCQPIRKLSVSLHRQYGCESSVLSEGWQVALVEQWLRHALGHLVEDITVASEVK